MILLLCTTVPRRSSVKYVSGEIKLSIDDNEDKSRNGINTPPKNNRGNFTILTRTIISEVWSVALAETNNPKRDPNSPINKIPKNIIKPDKKDPIRVGIGNEKDRTNDARDDERIQSGGDGDSHKYFV